MTQARFGVADPKPHPAYRESGPSWLGLVPAHWEMRRLRDSVDGCINGIWGDDPNGHDDLLCVRVADFDRWRLRVRLAKPTMRAIAPNERRRRMLRRGDLLLEKSGGGELQPVGAVVLYDRDAPAVCSNFVARMPAAAGFNSSYLAYLHAYLYAIRLNVRSIKQTTGIQNLDSSSYLGEPIAYPPLIEQSAIARYLAHADRRIGRYIRAKQKLIKLLEELKQVVIHRAVTRGLDPCVRLKRSGLESPREVPEHWVVKRLKYLSPEITVGVVVNPSSYFVESGIPMLLGNNVLPGRFRLDNVRRISPASNEVLKKSRLRAGDLVVVRVGAPGVAAVIPEELDGCNCASMMIVRRGRDVEPKWMEHLFNSPVMRHQIDMVKYGAAQKQFNISHAVDFLALIPCLEEQLRILAQVDRESRTLDHAIRAAEREVDLSREYRTRLIADVVTGRLDVREAAAKLPEEPGEIETIDEPEAEDALEDPTDSDEEADEGTGTDGG